MKKSELRTIMRNRKREYSQTELEALSLPVIERILSHPRIIAADTILAYHSLADEVNTHELVDTLVSMGKNVLLPKVVSDTEMTLHPYTKPEDLTAGSFNILEPNTPELRVLALASQQVGAERLERRESIVALVPGMAFDKQGHRLGRGKGYYDRLFSHLAALSTKLSAPTCWLAKARTYKIGVCFPFQIVDEVPHDEHDIKMNEIIF